MRVTRGRKMPRQARRTSAAGGEAAPPFPGAALIETDPEPLAVAGPDDVIAYATPPELVDFAAFEWRVRLVPDFATPTTGHRVILGLGPWLGVGSSELGFVGDSIRFTHSGGSTSPTILTPTFAPGDVVDIGIVAGRHLGVRVNGGTAVVGGSTGPVSGGWQGYPDMYIGGGPPGSPYGITTGTIYAPRALDDWATA